jgi:NAD-dependent SIR2 family protein deacetylase
VGTNAGDAASILGSLESVRCLECGAVYAKPAGGGTARRNPGCPDCGYVGWIDAPGALTLDLQWRRFAADRRLRRSG